VYCAPGLPVRRAPADRSVDELANDDLPQKSRLTLRRLGTVTRDLDDVLFQNTLVGWVGI
jgi:hypothetical protein